MKGEQDNIRRAKHLFSIYEILQKSIKQIQDKIPESTIECIAPDLLLMQKEIVKEYDELYLLLKIRYLIDRKDFNELNLKYIDFEDGAALKDE
ncbi:hypothetical protein [Xylocopilactobacillus apis]|uniref:Uncharacterized protein n=1 Tax=Xylocopilactobacillus apis TaxID=2932183 RepID=A0AAU9D7I7_9LACO|nr:hypothetical protein [Xylocopilactobacillus apis]BDR55635.1 hypothetical protein KIMC2_01970 [Xylocopilactobacillus apis]